MRNVENFIKCCKPAPVWFGSTVPKNGGRKDIREFYARAAGEGDTRTFICNNTFRDFDRAHFTLEEGCELRDSTGIYRCIELVPLRVKKKILPMLITQRVA